MPMGKRWSHEESDESTDRVCSVVKCVGRINTADLLRATLVEACKLIR
jgi:hypothetical protein